MKTQNLITLAIMMLLFAESFSQIRSGENIVINKTVNQDLYVAGGSVTINAPIKGDLIVAGGTIIVNDTITQDILMVGGNVTVNGYIGDDMRCAGGTISLLNNVKGDVLIAGGRININKEVVIYGNLISCGGEFTLDGEVKGYIENASGTFTLNGIVRKDFDSRSGKILINGTIDGASALAANKIELGDEARFNGEVRYWNKDEFLDFGGAIHNGKPVLDTSLEIKNGNWLYFGFASLMIALWYLGTALLMIFVIQYLFNTTLKSTAITIKNASVKSLGIGALFLVAVPIASVVAFVTIVGIPIGIILLMAYGTLLLLATIIVSLLISHWINNTYYESLWGTGRIVLLTFGIFIVLKMASLMPFVGPLVMLMLVCMAFGGLIQNIKWKHNKNLALT